MVIMAIRWAAAFRFLLLIFLYIVKFLNIRKFAVTTLEVEQSGFTSRRCRQNGKQC